MEFFKVEQTEEYATQVTAEVDQAMTQRELAKTTKTAAEIRAAGEPQDGQQAWRAGSQQSASAKPLPTRTKMKTRPETQDSPPQSTQIVEEKKETEDDDVNRPRVTVKKDNLNILSKLYPDSKTKGSVKWTNFVEAMIDAGFAVIQGSGSAVSFKYTDGKMIVFHRPHPEPVVDPIMLQAFGKRLRKYFGWERDVFEERGHRVI